MALELASLILNSNTGRLAHSTWKTILGIAVGVGLILFITAKLDGFIVNMEDYMLSFMPEVQFQRTKNAMPTQLRIADARKFQALLEHDEQIIAKGPAFFQMGIYQFKSPAVHINKRSLALSGLVADMPDKGEGDDNVSPPLLLNIAKHIRADAPLSSILADNSRQVIISTRLADKLFPQTNPVGMSFQLGERQTQEAELIEVSVAGVYVNSSVNAVFMSKQVAALLTKNNSAQWANTYIVRLKDKYQAKAWRQALLDNLSQDRDVAGYYVEHYRKEFSSAALNDDAESTNTPASTDTSQIPKHQREFRQWQDKFHTAQESLDFLRPFQIQSWMDISPENLRHLKMTRVVTVVILSAVLVLTAVSIKFLFDTIVIEKRRQIATLKALGFGNRAIMFSFLFAGLFIGAMGVLIGGVLGLSLGFSTAVFEARFFETMFGIQYQSVALPVDFIFKVGLTTICLSLLSAFFPMWSTLKIQPIEGIRREG